jgi:hypothetical protein
MSRHLALENRAHQTEKPRAVLREGEAHLAVEGTSEVVADFRKKLVGAGSRRVEVQFFNHGKLQP